MYKLPGFDPIEVTTRALREGKRIKVVESDTAPKTYVAGLLWAAAENGEREPIGARIVEVPDNLHQFESRDSRSTFTAYVPVGSIAKGQALVMNGGPGKTAQCTLCHGPDLKGLDDLEFAGLGGRLGGKDWGSKQGERGGQGHGHNRAAETSQENLPGKE